MANNLATIEPRAVVPAFTFHDMQNMATAFARGGMFGSQDPHAVLSLMLVAQAEGKHPAQIMQDYHVVQGKPAKKADAMLRDFIGSGGSVKWHELTDDVADATFSHPQGGSVRITWDNDRVQQAGIGGNPMHKKYPRQMKRSRCVSEGVRTVYPGATGGFYVPEEVADFDDAPAKPEPRKVRAVTDDKRAKAEEWTAAHVAEVAVTDDPEGLAQKTAGAVAKLETQFPDLFDRVADAWAARKQEGGAQMEAETDAPPSDGVAAWKAQIDACETLSALGKCEAEFMKSPDAEGPDAAAIEQAFDDMRQALKGRAAK